MSVVCLLPISVARRGGVAALVVGQQDDRRASHDGRRSVRCPQAGESILVQKWYSPRGGQVHYTDVAAGASNDRRGLQLSSSNVMNERRS